MKPPEPPLKQFAGIQYFFKEDFRFFPGHMYYPDSPWRLTSISQMQFRQDRALELSTNRGLVSVVIGAWNVKGTLLHKKTAWDCNDKELAEECWAQVAAGFGSAAPPTPTWYHVDRSMRDPNTQKRYNGAPYLTTTRGRFKYWPGKAGHYRLNFGTVALAGSYMQTYTRLVTMESANESGRHAVNAILDHWAAVDPMNASYVGSKADTWNPEDEELPNLEYLHRIDERLVEEGLPHAFEILGLENLVGAPEGDGHPPTLMDALTRVGSAQGRALTSFVETLRRAAQAGSIV
jgi:hypothetical protein